MIKITVEIIPYGIGKPKIIGVMTISNTGKSLITPSRGDYTYKITKKNNYLMRSGEVENFPRKKLLVWDLLYRILRKEFGERNK